MKKTVNIKTLFSIATIFGLVVLSSCLADKPIPKERKRVAIATVEDPDVFGMHGSSYTRYVYYINYQEYEYQAHILPGVTLGEKCLVEYDYLYPDRKNLRRDSSFFLPTEKTAFTVGTLIRVSKRDWLINFKYTVKTNNIDKEYERLQELDRAVKNYPQLVNGANLF